MDPKTTRHLFHTSTEPLFKACLNKFHEQCGTHLVMCGVGPVDCDVQTIKMAPMRHDWKYCSRLMGGMIEQKPNIYVVLHDEDQNKQFELYVTLLEDPEQHMNIDMNGVFLHQIAYDYPDDDKCLYQFWKLTRNEDLNAINSLWHAA